MIVRNAHGRTVNSMNMMKNGEGYYDPTAYNGTKDLIREENEISHRNHELIQLFRQIVNLAGFEIVGRITLRHKESGKVFR